jgi:RimJ/RimL family protein N-acetyltransferase
MIIKMFEDVDLDNVFEVFKECGENLFTNPQLVTRENIIQNLLKTDDGFSVLFCIYNDDFCGFMTLNNINYQRNSAFIGNIAVKKGSRQYTGLDAAKWLINYSFKTLNLNRVYGHTWSDNPKMDAFYNRIGAVQEGIEREHTWKNGSYVNLKIWGILRSEWDANS